MNFKETGIKVKNAVLKIGQRNLIIIGAVLLVGIAVAVNLILFSDSEPSGGKLDLGGMNLEGAASPTTDTYFSQATLNREKARDESMEVLQSVVSSADSIEDVREKALDDITQIALDIQAEANIETLIKSKGFEECVVVISGGNASVIVKSDALLETEAAQIKEIVYEQAGIAPTNLKIIEKSA